MNHRRFAYVTLLTLSILASAGCATVPKETVQLSTVVGQNIEQLHTGYRNTVKLAFQQMRETGLEVIDQRWTPIFLKEFITTGKLIESAKEGKTERVEYWARLAIQKIDQRRQEFLKPLQEKEVALLAEIDDAFVRTIRANAAVTANLNSVLKVQTLQDQVIDSVGLGDLRKKINDGIAGASSFAADATKKIKLETDKLEGVGN